MKRRRKRKDNISIFRLVLRLCILGLLVNGYYQEIVAFVCSLPHAKRWALVMIWKGFWSQWGW